MGQYSIRDVETLSGVKAHTLRIWEQRYGFLKPNRTDTNIRFYSDEQLKLILNICTLNKSGMRISKIVNLEQQELCKEVQKLSDTQGAPHALSDALIHSMLDFDEARFEKTLSCAIMKHGFEKAFTELIFPMLSRAGVLWATGAVRSAQEHFISSLIRRKLCVAIDNQYVEKTPHSRKFVLFLPEGEIHELILLFTEYVLRQRHHDVIYLGTSLPFEELEFVTQCFLPDYLLTYLTVPPFRSNLQQYLDNLSDSFPSLKILVGGKQVTCNNLQIPDNVKVIMDAPQLLSIIQ
jgi:DNA-binding transcriptional MerR regulator